MLIVYIAFALMAVNGWAADLSSPISTLGRPERVTVSGIIDPVTLQLADGRIVRLAGVEAPDLRVHAAGPYAVMARDVMADYIQGASVQLYAGPGKAQSNRMGHILAHVVKDGGLWVQGLLLDLGLVRVRTTPENSAMAGAMLAQEDLARRAGHGIWAEDQYRILTPEDTPQHLRQVHIVEGRIVSTALRKNKIYINFGSNWRTDFTITIAPEDKLSFSRLGLDPLSWGGKLVRVRGWLDEYNGPYIQATHPAMLELLE